MQTERIESLTPREREILIMIGEGNSLAEIAQKLHRSLKTVESHRLSLGRKLAVSNRVELAKIAIAEGLVSVSDAGVAAEQPPQDSAHTELAWLEHINRAVATATGATFIKRFCEAASVLPGVNVAAVCTPDPTSESGADAYCRYIIAVANRGVSGEPARYHATGTPCETIINDGECCVAREVAKSFPDDAMLRDLKAESYIGIQLTRRDGSACGGIALIGDRPVRDTSVYRRVVQFYAPRLAAELDLCVQIDALRQRCETLEAQAPSPSDPHPGPISPDTEAALGHIDQDLRLVAGPAFLRGLVNSLCLRLGLKSCGICVLVDHEEASKLASVMYSVDGKTEENFVYNPINLPCETTIRQGLYSLPRDASKAYPDDDYFHEMGIDAYIGIRLNDREQQAVGTMWVCHTQAIQDPARIEHILHHYAPRVGAELVTFREMERLLIEQDKLRSELADRWPTTDVKT